MTSTAKDGTIIISDYYEKDGKKAMIMSRIKDNETITMSMYNNGIATNTYWVTPTENKAKLNSSSEIWFDIFNVLEVDGSWNKFLASLVSFIGTKKYDGKDCYISNNFLISTTLNDPEKNEYYIEKDTGLFIYSNVGNIISKREYEFDNVSDEVFIEPDVSQFTISE